MKRKREYTQPEYEITLFSAEDVVTSSAWEVTGVDLGDLEDF